MALDSSVDGLLVTTTYSLVEYSVDLADVLEKCCLKQVGVQEQLQLMRWVIEIVEDCFDYVRA